MNCRECRGPRGPALRREWGCDREIAPHAAPHFLDLTLMGGKGREPVTRCPILTTPEWVTEVATLFAGWRKGFLPIAGSLADQGAWTVEALGFVEFVMANIAKAERDG